MVSAKRIIEEQEKSRKLTFFFIETIGSFPNIGFINFLGLKELPSYQNQSGSTCIIQNLMKLDIDTVKMLNLDKIEQGIRLISYYRIHIKLSII